MKLLPGDHVAQKDLTDEQYHAIAKKFMEAGAIVGEYPSFGNNRALPFFGSHPQDNDLFHGQKHVFSGRLLTPSQILEDDNGWFERGELPPVGTVCELTHDGLRGEWETIEILKHDLDYCEGYNGRIACISISGIKTHSRRKAGALYWFENPKDHDVKFRPIKSDRDKAIEAACKVLISCSETDIRIVEAAKALFDAGLLKLPEGDK